MSDLPIIKKHNAVMVFSVSMMNEDGEVVGHLQKVHIVPPRKGKGFEGSTIDVQTSNNKVQALFTVPL